MHGLPGGKVKHLDSELMMAKNVEEFYVIISKIEAKVKDCWQVKDPMSAHTTMKIVAPRKLSKINLRQSRLLLRMDCLD
jgi:hypothetical protein